MEGCRSHSGKFERERDALWTPSEVLISILAMLSPESRMGGKINESANSLIWCRVAGESGERLIWKRNEKGKDAALILIIICNQNTDVICLV